MQSLGSLEPPAPPRGGWTVYSCLRTVPRGSQASKADAEAGPLHRVVPSPSEGEGIFGSRRRNNFQPTKDKEATFWKCARRVDTGQKGRVGTPLPHALEASSAPFPILPLLWNWLIWVQRQANTPLCPEQNSEHSQSPCQGSATGQPGRWSCVKGPEQAQGPEDMLRFPNCVLLCTSMLVCLCVCICECVSVCVYPDHLQDFQTLDSSLFLPTTTAQHGWDRRRPASGSHN